MSSFQGVVANPVTFSTFTHTCSCSVTTNRSASFIVSHREIHSEHTVSSETCTQQTTSAHSHLLHQLSQGGTADSHCLSLLLPPRFVPLCFLDRSFLVSLLGGVSPATVISDFCHAGRGEVGQEIPGQIEAMKVETKGIASALSA